MKLTKYVCRNIGYFHEDSVTSWDKKEEIKKDCAN